MSELFDEFQAVCSKNWPTYGDFSTRVQQAQRQLPEDELVRSYALLLLSNALADWQKTGEGALDVLVLLRQVIRSYEQRFLWPVSLWEQFEQQGMTCGLWAREINDPAEVELVADDWLPDWLAFTVEIDRLRKRRADEPATGDGLLFALTQGKFWQYQSQAQQIAAHTCLFAEPSATLLVMLPTGSGKSILAQLPAWNEQREQKGLTIVVVPTVALAIEQLLKAHLPARNWTSQTSQEERRQILQEIQTGELPLLYVSPEALMQSGLRQVCLQAAAAGKIQRLVIDEAHLIESWGAGFRTDFQFLATYRAQLLKVSTTPIQTFLFSATVSASCIQVLKQLFSEPGPFYELEANRLRPEPGYWFSFSQSPSKRQWRVLNALHYLPRPAIIYVTRREAAREWYGILKQEGFCHLATFTGETDDDERVRLIEAWNDNQLDLMVATSAFGVGVDKTNVRTIIHACLPESVERFYQEVGRAGRDGYNSISLVCCAVGDEGIAQTTLREERITLAKALARWEGMRLAQRFQYEGQADRALVDLDAPPTHDLDMHSGRSNLRWNEHTLLLMQRAGLLKITGTHEALGTEEQSESGRHQAIHPRYLQIQLLRPEITADVDNDEFRAILEGAREQERRDITANLQQMKQVISDYAYQENWQAQRKPTTEECLAHRLARIYQDCAQSCGGCPACRAQGRAPYRQRLTIRVEPGLEVKREADLAYELSRLMGSRATLTVKWEQNENEASRKRQLREVLADLVWAGMRQILLPDELMADQSWMKLLLEQLAGHRPAPHQLVNYAAWETTTPLYDLPTVLVYAVLDSAANRMYRNLFRTIQIWQKAGLPLMHVVFRQLYLEREQGRFVDKIEGNSVTLGQLHTSLKNWQEPHFL